MTANTYTSSDEGLEGRRQTGSLFEAEEEVYA